MSLLPGFVRALLRKAGLLNSHSSGTGVKRGTIAESHPGAPYRKGEVIGNAYEVFGILGVGGFGVVYLVRSRDTGKMHALKTLRDEFLRDAESRDRFRSEAKVWVDLDRHPNLVQANFVEELSGRLYICMEYVEPDERGLNSLEGYIRQEPPHFLQSLRWAIQCCRGMEYAYSRGIRCHRDIKPANIMITKEKDVKITDFGFADVLGASGEVPWAGPQPDKSDLPPEKRAFGSPVYMPPEQFINAASCDARSDVYSFGVVLFQMATRGKLPYFPTVRGRDPRRDAPRIWRDMHRLHARAPIPPLKSPLYPIVHRCLRKDPAHRYQSFSELRADLDLLLQRHTGEVVPMRDVGELQPWELYNKAFSLSSLGDLEEAVRCYDMVLAAEPRNSDAWNNKGACLRRLGRLEEAVRCYTRSIEIDPGNVPGWSNRGNSLYKLGRYKEALADLDKALSLEPVNESAWLHKAVVSDRLGMLHEAASAFRKFLKLPPRQYAPYIALVKKRLRQLEEK